MAVRIGTSVQYRTCRGGQVFEQAPDELGDEPIVLNESGAPAAVNLKSGLFRAEIFSQNAVESIADRPLFQLDLIDSIAGSASLAIALDYSIAVSYGIIRRWTRPS